MLSLIVCSRTPRISEELEKNIAETIGCEYELVVIDNSNNRYSICSAYNFGVEKSKGEFLCFLHEDVLFHTKNWGRIIEKSFEKNKIGLIGVVGGHYLPNIPCTWNTSGIISGGLLQGYTEDGIYKTHLYENMRYKKGENIVDVVAVDGLFMAMQKSIFEYISWDENLFNDFHFYDMDICMQIQVLGFRVVVLYDLLIEHKSLGNYNTIWACNRDRWYKKWEKNLPIIRGISEELTEVQWFNRAIQQESNYKSILSSKTYQIGKILTFPYRIIKSIIKK